MRAFGPSCDWLICISGRGLRGLGACRSFEFFSSFSARFVRSFDGGREVGRWGELSARAGKRLCDI